MVRKVRIVVIGLEPNRLLGLSKFDRFQIMSTSSLIWALFFHLVRHEFLGSAIHGSSLAYVTTACGALIKHSSERRASTIAFIFILRRIDMSLNANDPTRWTRLPQLTNGTLDFATERWLAAELRSDHAGEMGAVAIYNGILKATRDPELILFALDHRETEKRHLASIEELVTIADRSRLLFAWKVAGFATGFIPALFGRKAVYATIDAVETFVERHYSAQINRLAIDKDRAGLKSVLVRFRDDEIEHRDQARARAVEPIGLLLSAWCWLVGVGSAGAVALARRV